MTGTRTLATLLALTLCLPGCGGCGDDPGGPPSTEKTTAAAPAGQTAAAPPSGATGLEGPPAAVAAEAHPLATGWQRAIAAEPSPEARGLYRRAIERVHAGAPNEAAPLFARIRADFADSRFAARLKGGGDPAATAALLGLAATIGAAAFAGALQSIQQVKPKGPGGP